METSLALSLSGLGFILSVIWGGPLLRVMKHFKLGKSSALKDLKAISPRWVLPPWAAS